ncbi:BgTH12-06575 [Blumeria graminis f. sp. triticale]|uniref:Bgt-1978 n=3 Tax=Blumeria graminis TaxID=34373 RepID=A0A061HHZ6_BLUGR|nr:hypothetical protein BGT96224_1978 [Blumeria graminis f. sp. tritici 96224]CAD6500870.1 BgTH12-06575 [Blumeria graminis f. sp. triticale]VCU41162.1 Bgt-1978 [Blumeria graminis f. sp. tritici]
MLKAIGSILIPTSMAIFLYLIHCLNPSITLAILLYRNRAWLLSLVNVSPLTMPTILAALTICCVCYGAVHFRRDGPLDRPSSQLKDECAFKPLFFPCRTTHRRMFPVKHSFAYSYLLTGIPVGLRGSVGGLLSVDEVPQSSWWSRHSWYVVSGDDYLARGHHPDGLQGKLRDYLESQGVDHKQYSHAYLLTAAKFQGYSSNPVSLWHLYSPQNELKALILEVNNTFDERHCYFLQPSSRSGKASDSSDQNGPEFVRYACKWPKDFYVSTFNDRSGSYSLSASDPFAPALTGSGHINTTITLSGSSHDTAMIITRIFSINPAHDPAKMSKWEKLLFLTTWWWVGFATFPRTLRQAYKLFFYKKMPWAFRPEPRRNTMARQADKTERNLEQHFRAFLKNQVCNSEEAITVRYQSAGLVGNDNLDAILQSPLDKAGTRCESTIKILTPLFYSRFVQYASISDALISESQQSATLEVSNLPSLLTTLTAKVDPKPEHVVHCYPKIIYEPLFVMLSYLRSRPSPILSKEQSTPVTAPARRIPSATALSVLETFVLDSASSSQKRDFLQDCWRLMLTARLAFESSVLWELEVLGFHVIVSWYLVRWVCTIAS